MAEDANVVSENLSKNTKNIYEVKNCSTEHIKTDKKSKKD
jgi:hypothetical protein